MNIIQDTMDIIHMIRDTIDMIQEIMDVIKHCTAYKFRVTYYLQNLSHYL